MHAQRLHVDSEGPLATSATIGTIELNDGNYIPPTGFGTWGLNDRGAERAIVTALRVGYRLIDTAASYGNEAGIGRGIRASGVPRDEIVVTTKVEGDDHGYDRTRRAFDASAKRLGLDRIDLYLIHWPLPGQDKYVGTWKALVDLHEAGRARSIGVSNFDREQIENVIGATGYVPAVNQVELNPSHQQIELRSFHESKRILTEAWSPLGRGALLDDPVIERIAAKHERTPAQIILRWCMELGIVAIPKSQVPSRMRENIDVFDFKLDAEDLAAIAKLDES